MSLKTLSFTLNRASALEWLKVVVKALWRGEYRVHLRVQGTDFIFTDEAQ